MVQPQHAERDAWVPLRDGALVCLKSSSSVDSAGFMDMWTTFGLAALKRHSLRAALSSSMRPKCIRRM